MSDTVNVGIIGCGNIAPQYVKGCGQFPLVHLIACADIDHQRAEQFAAEHNLQALSIADLLAHPEIEIIINLTIPRAHVDVSLDIINAGKHVYSEKPLAVTREDGKRVLDAARKANVRVGCAPDTFLGGGIQTCRKLIDDGAIGTPIAATSFMANHGHESWHPNPAFYYAVGGGPLLDMGPYYLTALVTLLGPARRVSGSVKRSFETRIATSEGRRGQEIPVHVATHLTGVIDFVDGATVTMMKSFDVWQHRLPIIEIYGTEGTLSVPDPNRFDGVVQVWSSESRVWRNVPLTHAADVGRGIGVADMAYAIRSGRAHRASGDLAYHVLDVMQAVTESSQQGTHINITSTCERPAPLPVGLPAGVLDA
ncbi:MAG: gfo/Idh/MocA family oxidoreductase [Chloroflexi bacterium]|nr:MAG: oxidoreductase [Phototrophicales bacterium]RMF77943.1 MAG: gfo/Idh/MocA family oxidoreductase [Chloroflexota bacterium]